MSEQVGVVLIFLGLFLVTSGSLVLLVRGVRLLLGRVERRRLVGPALLVAAGLVVGAAPMVTQLAWDAFVACTAVAKKLKLHGAGQDLLADAFSGNVKGQGPGVAETYTAWGTRAMNSSKVSGRLS